MTFTTLPSWILVNNESVDLDFADSQYYGDALANLVSDSRASASYAADITRQTAATTCLRTSWKLTRRQDILVARRVEEFYQVERDAFSIEGFERYREKVAEANFEE
jgi:hypothetical protein